MARSPGKAVIQAVCGRCGKAVNASQAGFDCTAYDCRSRLRRRRTYGCVLCDRHPSTKNVFFSVEKLREHEGLDHYPREWEEYEAEQAKRDTAEVESDAVAVREDQLFNSADVERRIEQDIKGLNVESKDIVGGAANAVEVLSKEVVAPLLFDIGTGAEPTLKTHQPRSRPARSPAYAPPKALAPPRRRSGQHAFFRKRERRRR